MIGLIFGETNFPIQILKKIKKKKLKYLIIDLTNSSKFKKESKGKFLDVSDNEIINAYNLLGKNEGIFCEPASAASIAGLLITTECVVVDEPEKEAPAAPPMPPGGGMGGMM